MVTDFIRGALALMLAIPFAVKANNLECLVNRTDQPRLHAYNCKKVGKVYQVQSCDTGWICRAKKKNVTAKEGACKDSTSAPKFMDAYYSGNKGEIAHYLKTSSSTLHFQAKKGSEENDVVQKLSSSTAEQKVAYIELAASSNSRVPKLQKSQAIAKVAADRKIEFIYTSSSANSDDLSAFKVVGNKLKKTKTSEAIPNCGDK